MTEVITRNRLAANANAIMVNNMNSGISWGTNNYPANSNPGWFAGTNGGVAFAAAAGHFQAGVPSPSQTVAALRAIANNFGGIRTTRIVIYMATDGAATPIYDGTAVANTIYGVGDFAAQANLSMVAQNTDMDLNVYNTACNALWSAYVANCRNQVLTLTNTICHTSCHTSCHSSRGRR